MAYATGTSQLDRLLDGVSTAQIDPDTVFSRLREAILAGSKALGDKAIPDEAIYAALRNAVWIFVASGAKGPHLNRWADLILRVRQFLRVRQSSVAERLTTLADMMEKSVNAADASGKVKLGKHHLLILKLLQERGGECARAELSKETGLKDSNLSHVLTKLAASRLIDRIPIGREATIRITENGQSVLSDPQPSSGNLRMDEAAAFEWAPPECALAVADLSKGYVRSNQAFASILETTPDSLAKMPATTVRESLFAKIQLPDPELRELIGADGRTRCLVEREQGDRTYWIAYDVTAYTRKIDELKKRERTLSGELACLRLDLADYTPRVHAHPGGVGSYALAHMMQEMSPDVMTPVHSIEATARLLAKSPHLKGQEGDFLSSIIKNSDHLKNVLGGMIAVADADPYSQVPRPFSPNSVAKEIADNFAHSAKHHGYTIVVDPGEDHEVVADGYAFKAALQNTVAGVIRSLPRGGKVGIRTTSETDGVRVELIAEDSKTSTPNFSPKNLDLCQAYVNGFGAHFNYAGGNGVVRASYHWPSDQARTKSTP
jgi:DNA-binding MarR family transcriptional regulator